jgi:glycosyltransferase involved in cell wall biosynthesis
MTQQSQPVAATLSIVIPVYNEKDLWLQLLARVEAAPTAGLAKEIILVEDGSTDGTREQIQQYAAGLESTAPQDDISRRVLFHDRNQGKGAALRTGFAAATGDIVIVQDADLEYDPGEYERLLEPILAGRADVVYGSRFAHGRPEDCRLITYVANRFLTWLSNRFTHLGLTDMETCYKLFRREVIQRVSVRQDRFGFEPEVTAKVAQMGVGVRLAELPISYHGRGRAEGKKIGFRDGLKAIWCIAKYGLGRRG